MVNRGVKKGIILAGGNGSRLYPITQVVCKQLLPVYDKPMIYYPLSTLMQFGIREILIITTPNDLQHFQNLFGDGSHLGLKLSYATQASPDGIAQAFLIGREFIGNDAVALILGDNIFHGIGGIERDIAEFNGGAIIFGYRMKNPQRYGVIEFDGAGDPVGIEEKPAIPKSDYAVTGFYVYDSDVIGIAGQLKPSARGELEITDINNAYLSKKLLKVVKLDQEAVWLDTGTYGSLSAACNFVATMEKRQGIKPGCIEEMAFQKGFINAGQFNNLTAKMTDNEYRKYLQNVLKAGKK